jgi:hypothetical protein
MRKTEEGSEKDNDINKKKSISNKREVMNERKKGIKREEIRRKEI